MKMKRKKGNSKKDENEKLDEKRAPHSSFFVEVFCSVLCFRQNRQSQKMCRRKGEKEKF